MSKKWKHSQALTEHLMSAENDEVRGVTFTVPEIGMPIPDLYAHQKEALNSLISRPISTILHLPTGSGKTRIALELIAATLKQNPKTKIIWASYPTNLIRQSMIRLAQFSQRLPKNMTFCWAKSDAKSRSNIDLVEQHQVIFALRGTLTGLLADVRDRSSQSTVRAAMQKDTAFLIIYDECHQLGSRQLQRAWRAMERKKPTETTAPRIVGLSATPLPQNPRRRILLRKKLFPQDPNIPDNPDFPWRMDVAYRVHNAYLERIGVLCPINVYQQNSAFFDIPLEVINRSTWRRPIAEPPESGATANELMLFSAQFNAKVMSHPLVLRFLAGRIATRIQELGKTLVFTPTIRSANALFALFEAHPSTRGRVFIAHTGLAALEQSPPLLVQEQIQKFAKMQSQPCIMINVNMLTTGFDDPKIQSIVLARLTYSMNLYWQMIGRGTRGLKSGGTVDCTVLDPIRLTRLYPIAEGYRPTLTKSNEDVIKGDGMGVGRLNPSLSIVINNNRGLGPDQSAVDESWFDSVELDEELLTAYQAPPKKLRKEVDTPVVTFGPQLSIQDGVQKRTTITGSKIDAWSRMWALTVALQDDTIQRVALAFGIPFAGETDRDTAADEIMDAVCTDGRRGASAYFDAIPSTELKRLVRCLDIPTPVNKKAAFVSTLIYDFLLEEAAKHLKQLLESQFSESTRGTVYQLLDKNYNKRGLQKLLDILEQPRSAKNKRILIRRIFETFLNRECSA